MILRERLLECDTPLHDLAKQSKIPLATIGTYLRGVKPTQKDFEKLCQILSLDADEVTFDDNNISVIEAAKYMEKHPNFVKAMIKKGVFGFYDGSTYHIPRQAFMNYMNGTYSSDLELFVERLLYSVHMNRGNQ